MHRRQSEPRLLLDLPIWNLSRLTLYSDLPLYYYIPLQLSLFAFQNFPPMRFVPRLGMQLFCHAVIRPVQVLCYSLRLSHLVRLSDRRRFGLLLLAVHPVLCLTAFLRSNCWPPLPVAERLTLLFWLEDRRNYSFRRLSTPLP